MTHEKDRMLSSENEQADDTFNQTFLPNSVYSKLSPALYLIVPTAAICTLVGFKATGWKSDERFAESVVENRTTWAIAVQILSHVLSLLQITALCMSHIK